ncbi:exosortase A [Novosphingobium ginsenosidimutans]|uniref:Exosortase A n=1 Tax=Novosphingobium ginsenosidimutans TaxID=1176536 RepID=A0A5B8S6T5_9SPHN|nr:exosortase A [Novosphingobium ginsenosidimutans]QEA16914.1 exosortase A [Novosphingobium ginsenosidimutans]
MPPESLQLTSAHAGTSPWRNALVWLGLVWAGLILAFAGDWLMMAQHWWDSSTYNHILLIPPILVWLVSLRVDELRKLVPVTWAPGLLFVASGVLLWVLGRFAGFSLVQQAGAVLVLPGSLLTLLGPRVGLGLMFPLGYMAFLVPFGDEVVPQLQMITAALTIGLVKLSGIPAVIDGVFIDTPAGLFEVAEACSGVKFLIAMIALGALVANVCFRSWKRRLLFMALCIVAPILANGVRAWGTILAAQYVGAEKAGGFDHIVYGWFFFALVIAAVLGLSWRHFDRAVDDPIIDGEALAAMKLPALFDRSAIAAPLAILLCGGLVLSGQAWARKAEALLAPMPQQIFLPAVPGWQRVDYAPVVPWEPRAAGAEHRLLGRYADASGRKVDVFLALYPAQTEGREATGFGEGALREDSEWSWNSAGPHTRDAKSDLLRARGSVERLAQTYYRNGDLLTGSALKLKLATIEDRLLLRRNPTVMLILSVEASGAEDPGTTLDRFRQATGPVGPWMDRIVALR